MRSWSTRFRRAAAVLLGLHVAQATALASFAPCEVRGPTASVEAVTVVPVALAHDHAAMHHEPTDSRQQQRSQAPSVCTMAMACAVVAAPTMPVSLPVMDDGLHEEERPCGTETMPTATALPPEPPPPKS